MSDQTGQLLERAKRQEIPALAKLLTALERSGPKALVDFPDLLTSTKPAFRVGITGPPGAGKSTLIGQMIKELRARGRRVAVLAVDPSSPFSKGAVLGDRIRYSEHFADPDVFIRSIGSRGSLGGLSASSYLMVRAFDIAGFDNVLIETVGVGQTELEVMNVADLVSVVLVPESGDSIQGMKAGLLEIADLFIVNKSDRPGADAFFRELEASLNLIPSADGSHPLVHATTALSGAGVGELIDLFDKEKTGGEWQAARSSAPRLRAEARALLRDQYEREIDERLAPVSSINEFADLFR